jgi:hypothetical protein
MYRIKYPIKNWNSSSNSMAATLNKSGKSLESIGAKTSAV